MAKTASTMLPLGVQAPPFRLPDPDGNWFTLEDFAQSPALLVMFLCNHCPFVKHVGKQLAQLGTDYQPAGVALLAISCNDVENYPADSPEQMKREAARLGYAFPYLYDEQQTSAKAYQAACTPDFFLFDTQRKLRYRGQLDASRPGNSIPVTGADLRRALDALLADQPIDAEQQPSIGCNIKWKPGNAPEYARP